MPNVFACGSMVVYPKLIYTENPVSHSHKFFCPSWWPGSREPFVTSQKLLWFQGAESVAKFLALSLR
ncbi:hypothetical protein GIB67_020770 [Kingdonia uniflora]|uniref:Uncharacterized protein n=1 Tax=Kingdonia uniflora TaxID=39325 RepID=A0A7J7M728_9MAGN|nr:hypothetical protein GIB67_020770 [Kingdonia uniflora]